MTEHADLGDSNAPPPMVTVTMLNQPPTSREWAAQVAAASLMACRNCRAQMVRGTQCQHCGAWCR